jgi:hypothetical protein
VILAEKAVEQQGAGEKAKRKREALIKETAAKKLKVQKEPAASSKPGGHMPISSFFPFQPKVEDKAATGTFPWDHLAPSPPVRPIAQRQSLGQDSLPLAAYHFDFELRSVSFWHEPTFGTVESSR